MLSTDQIIESFRTLFKETLKTSLVIFKIMIPVSIAIKVLEVTGIIKYFGLLLSPFMYLLGLPGEIGIVWATTIITNIYGGMIAYFALSREFPLNVAQVSILTNLMLIAHTFPVELQVAKKVGIRLPVMFLVRFGFALISGLILNFILTSFNLLQEPSSMSWVPIPTVTKNISEWLLGELGNYALIILVIFSLLLLMRILKYIGVIHLITKTLRPIVGLLGISPSVIPITVVGLTLGLLYGGALIISETKTNKIDGLEVFYSMVLMGLCHSLIEDSLLMISLGANSIIVFAYRILFALTMTYCMVAIVERLKSGRVRKFILNS